MSDTHASKSLFFFNFIIYALLAITTAQDISNTSTLKQPALMACILLSMYALGVFLYRHFEDN